MIGSMLGWVIELFFRRIFSTKKWINPGFLNGFYLPLYGFGVVIMYAICSINLPPLATIAVVGVLMTLLELVTGLFFTKHLNMKLWDYSNRPLNFKGIICIEFSLIWAALGALFLFVVYPPALRLTAWLGRHLYFLLVVGIFYGIFIADCITSFNVAAKIRELAKKAKEAVLYERLKVEISLANKQRKERRSFVFPFKSNVNIRENIQNYINKLKQKLNEKADAKKSTRTEHDNKDDTL